MDPVDVVAQTELEAIHEALARCNRECRRTTRLDNLGRENEIWAMRHSYLNYLLETLEDHLAGRE